MDLVREMAGTRENRVNFPFWGFEMLRYPAGWVGYLFGRTAPFPPAPTCSMRLAHHIHTRAILSSAPFFVKLLVGNRGDGNLRLHRAGRAGAPQVEFSPSS